MVDQLLWGLTYEEIISKAKTSLGSFLTGVCQSHGLDHSVNVLEHCEKALASNIRPVSFEESVLLSLAALLHDADDHKFFTSSADGNNATHILKFCSDNQISEDQTNFVLKVIDFVSCSKNHNRIPEEAIEKPELLYPRYADRLEALGEEGVKRTFVYTGTTKGAYFTENTPRPKTEEEIWKYATTERFENYKGGSDSMLDHFYDKLLHLANFNSGNPYFDAITKERRQLMFDVCLYFGEQGKLHPIYATWE